jgi:hypothetical protein
VVTTDNVIDVSKCSSKEVMRNEDKKNMERRRVDKKGAFAERNKIIVRKGFPGTKMCNG